MLKRELKTNFKSFIIWLIVALVLFGAAFAIYPTIMNSSNVESLNEMMKTMPEEMVKMFNMDISDIDTAFGWFKTEGYVYLLLIVGLYSSILGSSIILKEESEKTIEFLASKPVTRNKIVTSKLLCGIIYILLMILIVAIFNIVGMELIGSYDMDVLLKLSFAPVLVVIPLFLLCTYISLFFTKAKKTIGICMGITFVSYFLSLLSVISKDVEFIKYLSIFTLAESRSIVLNEYSGYCILISIIMSILFGTLIYNKYNKKELI